MGNYTIIASAGKAIIDLLCRELVPKPVKRTEDIGLCSPDEKGNYTLGLYLYDIEENPEVRNQEKIMLDREHFKNPPTSLNLYYMLFVSSESEISSRASDEQKILGKAIQVLNDYSRIGIDTQNMLVTEGFNEAVEFIDIQGIHMPFEEKQKVYSLFEKKIFTAFFYKVGPIFIESEKIKRIKRVTQSEFTIKQKKQ